MRILSSERYGGVCAAERFTAHSASHEVDLVVVMGRGGTCEEFVTTIADRSDVNILLVGADTPEILSQNVQRVRTPAACVEEAIAMLAPGAEPGAVGRL